MTSKNDEFLKRLLSTFRIEADAHIQCIASGLLGLKKTTAAEQRTIVETIFRAVHSLKGAARAVNLTEIEAACRSLENVFSAMKDKRLIITSQLVDLLLHATDTLSRLLATDDGLAEARKSSASLIRQLDDALINPSSESSTPISSPGFAALPLADAAAEPDTQGAMHAPGAASGGASATVRITAKKLDAVRREVEALLLPCLAAGQRARELDEAIATLAVWKKQRLQIQPALRIVNREATKSVKDSNYSSSAHELPKLLKYLDDEHMQMKMLEDQLVRLQRAADQDQRVLVGMTECLGQDVKEMQLLPFSSLMDILPRFSRELAREQGKSLEMTIEGERARD